MANEVDELNSRFSNTYVALKGVDGKNNRPVFVDRFYRDADGDTIIRSMDTSDATDFDTLWSKDKFIMDCPKLGMTFDGYSTYYISREPKRQWKGGYNHNIINMKPISHHSLGVLRASESDRFDRKILKRVFNPEYLTFKDGMEGVQSAKILNFPLSIKFAVSLEEKYEHPVIYYKNWIVGWVEDGTVQLPTRSSHLIEELSQYVPCKEIE